VQLARLRIIQAAFVIAAVSLPCAVAAEDLLDAEVGALGAKASVTWRAAQIGGSSVGGVRPLEDDGGPRDMGRKLKAGLLSLILPGAGQYYNGDRRKAMYFVGAEAAVWAGYLAFDHQGSGYEDDSRDYAGVYAGVSGGHDDEYWRAVGRYMDSDAYNEFLLREARLEEAPPPPLIAGDDAWQWRNQDYRRYYQELRADANRAYDRRDFMTVFAIVNRAVSVYDAVRNAGKDMLSTEIAGFQVKLDIDSSLRNPGTGCVFSRTF